MYDSIILEQSLLTMHLRIKKSAILDYDDDEDDCPNQASEAIKTYSARL